MDVYWPEPELLSNQPLHGIEEYLYALDLESRNCMFSEYPCILVRAQSEPRYAGKMWLIENAEREPVAFARVVYGRHVVTCTGPQAAKLFFAQSQWLRGYSSSSGNEGNFRATYVIYPELGIGGLGLSGARLKDVEGLVTEGDDGAGTSYSFASYENFMERAAQQLAARHELIERAIRELGGDLEGLPA